MGGSGKTRRSHPSDPPFAIVDIETTGFSPLVDDRIIEIAILRMTPDGSIEDQYETLVNPLRDVGPTFRHGITSEDVMDAPTFAEVVGDVLERLDEAVLVGHNVRFDRDFLAAELSMAGFLLPGIPSLCTLGLAYRLNPKLPNHKLATCCDAAGVVYGRAHCAIEDAKAAAHLLLAYIRQAEMVGWTSLKALGCMPLEFPSALWPSFPKSGRCHPRSGSRTHPEADVPFLARMVASLEGIEAEGPRMAPYYDLLDLALGDRQVTEAEAEALLTTARTWGLRREEVIGAHHAYLEALVRTAVADGIINEGERRDLEAVTRLLSIDPMVLRALLGEARAERAALLPFNQRATSQPRSSRN